MNGCERFFFFRCGSSRREIDSTTSSPVVRFFVAQLTARGFNKMIYELCASADSKNLTPSRHQLYGLVHCLNWQKMIMNLCQQQEEKRRRTVFHRERQHRDEKHRQYFFFFIGQTREELCAQV